MKKTLLLFLVLLGITIGNIHAQNRKISGKVVGADDGAPLPGVSITVKGTKRGVITDGSGQFFIQAAPGETLTATFVGYLPVSVQITAATSYPIKMTPDTKQLNEIVITDSYGTSTKKAYSGSAAVVSGATNENKPFSSPLQALQGEVAGLNIGSFSGVPGANVQVRLRGVGSIQLDANPLYVIDGMFINSGSLSRLAVGNTNSVLSGINEDDIESVTVLKDAAATAIYGSRGSNGVIVITTKRGKAGKYTVRADAELGITNNLPLPAAGKPLTGDQFATMFNEGLTNANYTAAQIASLDASYGIGGPSNNWYSLITNRGQQQQYNVSVSGGNDNTKVFSSLGYYKQQATVLASSLRRFSGTLNVDQTISKRVNLNTSLNISNTNDFAPNNGGAFASPLISAFFLTPFQLAYNPDGSLNSSRVGNTNFPSIYNPLYIAANDRHYLSQTRMLGSTQLVWNIWDELKFTSFNSIDYNVLEENFYRNPIMGDGRPVGNGYDDYTRYFNYLLRNQLSYRYNIKGIQDFYIDAAVGYEAQRNEQYLITAQSNGFPAGQPSLTASANASTPVVGNASFSNRSNTGLFSIATINYQNRYVLTGSFRRDGSSAFGQNQPFGNFYSVGGVWNVDEETFFKTQNVISALKLRSSIGTTGNANGLLAYGARPTASYGTNYNGFNGQSFNTIGNPDLTWESAQKFDIGFDASFLKNRLTVIFDYYNTKVNKLIQNAPISYVTGFNGIVENVGSMSNRGEEFAIKGVPFQTKDFSWTTNFNIAFNKNTVNKLLNDAPFVPTGTNFYVQEGRDFQTFYFRQYAGVDPANGNALWYTDATKSATTSNYNAASRIAQYQADPKYFGGFSNTFNYKGITLSADFYYNFGNRIYDSWAFYLEDGNNLTFNKYAAELNRWTTPGQITDVPKYVAGGIPGNASGSGSSRFLYYGDFLRLRNLVVGYDFKNVSFLKSLGLSKLYLYGRGTNLWTKTYDKRLPFDPELGPTGTSNLEVPQVRTFTVGLNVGF
ncbi:MAG: SusC/RagA family TonB-linked outer membrane protein [Mucilaginibacter sp.]